jgi:hypothetical protein
VQHLLDITRWSKTVVDHTVVRSNSTIFLVFGPYLLAPRSNFDDLVVYGKFPRSNFLLILYSMESLWSVIRSRDAPLSTAPLPPLRWLSGWLPSVTSSRLALVCQVHSTLLPPTSLIMDLPVELEKKSWISPMVANFEKKFSSFLVLLYIMLKLLRPDLFFS